MYIKANAKLFDGQDKFLYKQKEIGKLGGRPSALTDEEILKVEDLVNKYIEEAHMVYTKVFS